MDIKATISRANGGDVVLLELAKEVTDGDIDRMRDLIEEVDTEATFLIVPFGVVQGMSNLDLQQMLEIRSALDELIQRRLPQGVGDA